MRAAGNIGAGRILGAWLLLAIGSGIVLGIASRIAMRIVALEANGHAGFSVGGSLEVVAFGVIVGAPAAIVYWICRWRRPLPRGSGLIAGALLFLVLASALPPAAQSALDATNDTPIATVFAFAAAFAVYGISLDVLWHWMPRQRADSRLAPPVATSRAHAGMPGSPFAIIVLVLVALGAMAALISGGSFLEAPLPGGLPAGNLLPAVALCSLAVAAIGLSRPATVSRYLAIASLVAASAWLPVSIALAGNLALNFDGVRGWAWVCLTLATIVLVLSAVLVASAARLITRPGRRSSSRRLS